MRKYKVMIAVATALTVILAGCGSENKMAENQKKDIVKDTNKATEQDTKEPEKEIPCASELGTIGIITSEKTAENPTMNEETSSNVADSNISSTVGNASAGNNSHNNNSSTSSGNQDSNSNTTHTGGSGNGSGSATNSSSGNNSNNNTPAQTEQPTQSVHTHTWVHVDATGHYETVTLQAAYDEQVPVYENVEHSICNDCGTDITNWSENDIADHMYIHIINGGKGSDRSEWKYEQTGTRTIHHEAVTEQRWVEDTPAHEVCSGCGVTR